MDVCECAASEETICVVGLAEKDEVLGRLTIMASTEPEAGLSENDNKVLHLAGYHLSYSC